MITLDRLNEVSVNPVTVIDAPVLSPWADPKVSVAIFPESLDLRVVAKGLKDVTAAVIDVVGAGIPSEYQS